MEKYPERKTRSSPQRSGGSQGHTYQGGGPLGGARVMLGRVGLWLLVCGELAVAESGGTICTVEPSACDGTFAGAVM